MKSIFVVFFMALASVAFAQNDDFGANSRFHSKTGRDLPAVEQARPAASRSAAKEDCCKGMKCCGHHA